MSVSRETRRKALSRISDLPGFDMSFKDLATDILILSESWPNEDDFTAAVSSTVRAIELARDGRVSASSLKDDLAGWHSYHYQLRRVQGLPAELRLVYRLEPDGCIQVMGFGHRHMPDDFYHRIAQGRTRR